MKVMTVKLNPKTVFGLILVAAGVLVVLLTFLANHVKTGDAARATGTRSIPSTTPCNSSRATT